MYYANNLTLNILLRVQVHTSIFKLLFPFRTSISSADKRKMSLAPPLTKDVYVQTDYRDSQTQTDPYSPEYVVRPGSQPEVLTIASLCYGKYMYKSLLIYM